MKWRRSTVGKEGGCQRGVVTEYQAGGKVDTRHVASLIPSFMKIAQRQRREVDTVTGTADFPLRFRSDPCGPYGVVALDSRK